MIPIHLILGVLYLVLCLIFSWMIVQKRESWQMGLFCFTVCLALPLLGFLFLWVCDALIERNRKKDFAEFQLVKGGAQQDLYLLREPEKEKELNQVPMTEALYMNDFDYRRKMIMQLLNEEDTLQYLEVLQDALENEDTETSHYASTVIMELQRKVQEELIEKEVLYEQNHSEPAFACEWEKILYRVLESTLYDEQNLKRYFVKYYRVSDQLLAQERPEELYLKHRIEVMFKEKDYTRSFPMCQRYLDVYPSSEDAVRCQIEYFILTKNSAGMQAFLAEMSERPVKLTQKTLEYIRVFRKE